MMKNFHSLHSKMSVNPNTETRKLFSNRKFRGKEIKSIKANGKKGEGD